MKLLLEAGSKKDQARLCSVVADGTAIILMVQIDV
jgi:hypothetical protein